MENGKATYWLVTPGYNHEGEHIGPQTKLFDSKVKADEYSKELQSKNIGDYVVKQEMEVN